MGAAPYSTTTGRRSQDTEPKRLGIGLGLLLIVGCGVGAPKVNTPSWRACGGISRLQAMPGRRCFGKKAFNFGAGQCSQQLSERGYSRRVFIPLAGK